MLRRVRLRVISSGFRTENFEFFSRPQDFAAWIAPISVPPGDAQPRRDPQRSPTTVQSVSTREAARLHAIHSGFRTKNFEFFLRQKHFSVEIARDRAKIRAVW